MITQIIWEFTHFSDFQKETKQNIIIFSAKKKTNKITDTFRTKKKKKTLNTNINSHIYFIKQGQVEIIQTCDIPHHSKSQ